MHAHETLRVTYADTYNLAFIITSCTRRSRLRRGAACIVHRRQDNDMGAGRYEREDATRRFLPRKFSSRILSLPRYTVRPLFTTFPFCSLPLQKPIAHAMPGPLRAQSTIIDTSIHGADPTRLIKPFDAKYR